MSENINGAASPMEALLESYNERTEKGNPELTKEEIQSFAAAITSPEELSAGLRQLKEAIDFQKACMDNADSRAKAAGEDKKFWKARTAGILAIMEAALRRLNVPGLSLKADGIKLATSTRTGIEVDEEWLLGLSRPLADSLQAALPPYIKVKLELDKTALNAHLKNDSTLLTENPDKIHTKETRSTTLK